MSAPTLSDVRRWTSDYLTSAASHWDQTAAAWDDAYERTVHGVQSLGRSGWEGTAADAATRRVGDDGATVVAAAEALCAAADAARTAATELAASRRDLLDAVATAEAEAFVVDEDYSVRDLAWVLSPAAALLRRLQAITHAATLEARALALGAKDDDAAHAIIGVASRLGDLQFPPAPNDHTQPVDFHGVPLPERPGRPNPAPSPPPGGWSDDPLTRAAQHIAYGHANLKHLSEWPPGTTPEVVAKEVERIMRAAADPNGGMIVGRTGDGAPVIYDPKTNTIVIRDPRAADYGTVFKPTKGIGILKDKMPTRVLTIAPAELAEAPPRAAPHAPRVEPRVGLPPAFVPPRIVPGPSIGDGLPVIDADGYSFAHAR